MSHRRRHRQMLSDEIGKLLATLHDTLVQKACKKQSDTQSEDATSPQCAIALYLALHGGTPQF